jgi:hypothetical protein
VLDQEHWKGSAFHLVELLPENGGMAGFGTIELTGLSLEVDRDRGTATGVWIDMPAGHVALSNVSIQGFQGQGVMVAEASTTAFEGLTFSGNAVAIALFGCNGPALRFSHVAARDNGTVFQMGPWKGLPANAPIRAHAIDLVNTYLPERSSVHDRLLDADGNVEAEFTDVTLYFSGLMPVPLCVVGNSTSDSWVSLRGTKAMGGLRTVVEDRSLGRFYRRAFPRDHAPFDLCWSPGLPEGELPGCGEVDMRTALREDADTVTHPAGMLKSGESSISIGAETGSTVPQLAHGYNCSSLFSVSAGSDTALQHVVSQLNPKVLRFPGGTLANFYHPTGLGYGLRASDLATVEGSSVHDNMQQMFNGEQADIADGRVSGNYIHDMIDLALAANSPVLFVANLFTGTKWEMISALQAMVDAGVDVAGVELGNESHLGAYDSRFGSPENYLAVAGPYAQAIMDHFPGMKIGLDGYPPGILKDLGPGGTQRAHDWNVAVSDATFGDALIIHCYSRPSACSQPGVVPNFVCGASFSQTYANTKLPAALDELAGLGPKSIWITEWNIDGDYSHYGNSVSQSMFYADMSLTMAEQAKVTISACHNLLSWDAGYNIIKKGWQTNEPQINFYSSLLMKDLYLPGNRMQTCTTDGLDNVRAFAFLSADGSTQHLYLINRSGISQDLSGFDGDATEVNVTALGGQDIALGTGPNAARPDGDMALVNTIAADIHQVILPAYGVVHLSWAVVNDPPPQGPVWKTSFAGTDGCRLVANTGNDVVQPNPGKCAAINGGQITTSSTTSFSANGMVTRVVLVGVTFSETTNGRWVNGRARFMDGSGQIKDPFTGQVLATVATGTYYSQLVLEYDEPVPLNALIGKPNGGPGTVAMTMEALRIFQ